MTAMTLSRNVLSVVCVVLLAACASEPKKSTEPVKPAPDKEAKVTVTGAEAKVEDDGSITLNYPTNDDINYRVPDWVINPSLGGVTGAVGVAATSRLGMREQLDAARWNGRLELASMLELRVQRIMRAELEENVRFAGTNDTGEARRDTLGIDKQILDTVLAGTRQQALWWDTETNELYCWMIVDGKVLDRVDEHVMRGVSVFISTGYPTTEYMPERPQPKAPTVVVNMPETQPAPAPEKPKTQVEELEDSLKPIESIPLTEDGE